MIHFLYKIGFILILWLSLQYKQTYLFTYSNLVIMSTKQVSNMSSESYKKGANSLVVDMPESTKTKSDKTGVLESASNCEKLESQNECTFKSVSNSVLLSLIDSNKESFFESLFEAAKKSHLFTSNIDSYKAIIERYDEISAKIESVLDIAKVLSFCDKKAARKAAKESAKETKKAIKENTKSIYKQSKEEYTNTRYNYYISMGVPEETAKLLSETDYKNLTKRD